jgi:hypothetical protein
MIPKPVPNSEKCSWRPERRGKSAKEGEGERNHRERPSNAFTLKILQINLNCCVRAQDLLEATAAQQQTDVVLVNEPNVRMTTKKRGRITDCEGKMAIMNRTTKSRSNTTRFREGFHLAAIQDPDNLQLLHIIELYAGRF